MSDIKTVLDLVRENQGMIGSNEFYYCDHKSSGVVYTKCNVQYFRANFKSSLNSELDVVITYWQGNDWAETAVKLNQLYTVDEVRAELAKEFIKITVLR